jgi:hypothetical protein
MIYEEGEGYVLGPSPIPVHGVVIVLVVFVPMLICGFFFGLGYWTGHTAATAAIHREAE